ncbi:MAG: hypothetical protein IJ555_03125 [Ruminococcus sp.]|nr:hypothetical protein [Ruminococcus sp.]
MFNTVDTTEKFVSLLYAGKDSFKDFGVTISSYTVDDAEVYEVKASVPFMNGDYDFSSVTGKLAYKPRKVNVIFNIFAPDYPKAEEIRSGLAEWLYSSRNSELRFSDMKDRYFKNARCTFASKALTRKYRHTWELAATFTVYPLKILDYTRPAYYALTTTMTEHTYELPVDKEIIPCFTPSQSCGVLYGGVYYDIPAGVERYQISDIKFAQGVNSFSLIGTGELTVECIEEVL